MPIKKLVAWAQSVDAAELFVSAITVMELEFDVLAIERQDAKQGGAKCCWGGIRPEPPCGGRFNFG